MALSALPRPEHCMSTTGCLLARAWPAARVPEHERRGEVAGQYVTGAVIPIDGGLATTL
jgi:hypothetical protein